MSRNLSRTDALEDISNWSTSDVQSLLRKNGLEECCPAMAKRRIDGDELLHLTEGKLALWKSDLTRPLIWSLWTFVEKIRQTPEKYAEEKMLESRANEDHLSDTGSWGTDFEDETGVVSDKTEKRPASRFEDQETEGTNTDIRFQFQAEDLAKREGNYANCGSVREDETTYANFQECKTPPRNPSHGRGPKKSLAEQLQEQLKLRNAKEPDGSPTRTFDITSGEQRPVQPQKSFLHNASSIPSLTQKRMSVPPPPEPKRNKDQEKHPATIRNLDLLANLPARTEESDDEYEIFDEQIIVENRKKSISRVDSKISLTSGHRSSVESVYQPTSTSSHDQGEIYESITETPDDDARYPSPGQTTPNTEAPPPLPAKLTPCTPSTTKRTTPEASNERSPEKKSATLPHSSSNSSLSTERATRPLPPPPDRLSYVDKPWFHNVTRELATHLIENQSTYGSPQDGYFLLRPSTTNVNNPLALVLWYRDRVYNIKVRKRPDNRYALGTAKVNEQSFSSVEEMVAFYSREELVLRGMPAGSTKLTDTPPH